MSSVGVGFHLTMNSAAFTKGLAAANNAIKDVKKELREAGGRTIEVATPPFERYNARLQQRTRQTVFAGCTSWYVDAQGRHTVNWPGFTTTYRWLTRHAGLGAYSVR